MAPPLVADEIQAAISMGCNYLLAAGEPPAGTGRYARRDVAFRLLRRAMGGRKVMRGRKTLLILLLAAAAALPQASQAQFSPRGIIGTFTQPLRSMFGHFGHFPRRHRPHDEQEARQATTPSARFGDVGPSGWASAYEDIVGFTFWPGRYAGQIRAHGFDVVAAAFMSPGRGPDVARNATTGAAVQSDSNGNAADSCGPPPATRVEWPGSQIEQDEKLDDAQRAALGKLQTAVNEAIKT